MKNKMKKNPKTHYYIRGNEICCEPETVKEEESDEGEEESDDETEEDRERLARNKLLDEEIRSMLKDSYLEPPRDC